MDSSSDSDQTIKQSPWGGNAVQAQIQPQVPQQQVIIIQAKYQPDVNLRTWSIVILIWRSCHIICAAIYWPRNGYV